jgi:hypothetical protein
MESIIIVVILLLFIKTGLKTIIVGFVLITCQLRLGSLFSETKYGPNWYKVCTFRSALEGEYLEFWKAVLIRMVDIKALFYT